MNKKVISALIVIVIGIAAYLSFNYLTRPVAPPSQPTATRIQTPTTTETGMMDTTSTDPNTYSIVQEGSHANFTLDEILRGSPYTVVGTSTDVGGQIIVDRTKLQEAKMGMIKVNARTIKTDDERRNGMMGRFILKSEDPVNEFITFTATDIGGLPATADIGTPIHFSITGDLTIAGVTRPATFDANIVFIDDTTVTGTATTVVKRSDYNLTIPDIPFVANVTDDVKLNIEFTAKK